MTPGSLSLRASSIAAAALVGLWFLYIAVGWALAPQACAAPAFHMTSGVILVAAIFVVTMLARNSRGPADDVERGQLALFVRLFWLRLAGLFIVGMGLAWLLAAIWC